MVCILGKILAGIFFKIEKPQTLKNSKARFYKGVLAADFFVA
jgi:hypothetical protein